MLKIEALRDWLKTNGGASLAQTAFAFNRTPPDPDAIVILTEVPGLAMHSVEEAFDSAAVQVRVRARKNQANEARDTAQLIDRIFMDHSLRPFFLGSPGQYVPAVGRVGGPPVYLTTDNLNRASYVSTYWIRIQR